MSDDALCGGGLGDVPLELDNPREGGHGLEVYSYYLYLLLVILVQLSTQHLDKCITYIGSI